MSDNLPSPAVAADTPVWYYVQNKQKVGPVSLPALQQLAAAGQLLPTDMLWKQGTTEWVAATSVAGLFAEGNPTAAPATGRPGPAPGRETKDASADAALLTPPPAQPGTISYQSREAPAAGPPLPYPAIAGYKILGVLGRGGMGVVYQARHLAGWPRPWPSAPTVRRS